MIICRTRTSKTNLQREGSSFLEFQACYEAGESDVCDLCLCEVWMFFFHYNTCICMNIGISIKLVVNEIDEISLP